MFKKPFSLFIVLIAVSANAAGVEEVPAPPSIVTVHYGLWTGTQTCGTTKTSFVNREVEIWLEDRPTIYEYRTFGTLYVQGFPMMDTVDELYDPQADEPNRINTKEFVTLFRGSLDRTEKGFLISAPPALFPLVKFTKGKSKTPGLMVGTLEYSDLDTGCVLKGGVK